MGREIKKWGAWFRELGSEGVCCQGQLIMIYWTLHLQRAADGEAGRVVQRCQIL